mmetsp:Transcript_11426/g.33558  ORF Transcript_11426/g.33558 Transcript_11426/m.33558 type:complete len:109 (+) Transcript_11426:359-685(+)
MFDCVSRRHPRAGRGPARTTRDSSVPIPDFSEDKRGGIHMQLVGVCSLSVGSEQLTANSSMHLTSPLPAAGGASTDDVRALSHINARRACVAYWPGWRHSIAPATRPW